MTASPSSRGLWAGLALGAPIIAFGVAGAIEDASRTHPGALARWVVGAAVVHDLVFAPLVFAGGWALARLLRGRRQAWLRWALATSTVLVLFAWPLVRGYGRDGSTPSLLPRNYAVGLVAYLAGIWVVAVTATLVARSARRTR